MNLQPVLAGKLLTLRPMREEDFASLYAAAADPLLWAQHPASDRHKKNVFEDFFRLAMQSGGALVAIDETTGQIIGSSRYNAYDSEKDEVEIGWTFLARSHWGGLVNAEMKELMLTHAFDFVGNVIFRVGVTNLRSQQAMKKIGGVMVGTCPDAAGNDSYVYRITRSEFKQLALATRGCRARPE